MFGAHKLLFPANEQSMSAGKSHLAVDMRDNAEYGMIQAMTSIK